MQLLETLIRQLKKQPNFFNDSGELKKWVVLTKAQNLDAELIELLLENSYLKEKFFLKIKDSFVFNLPLFSEFLEQKNYLNDSYTAYKQTIGLNIDGKYLHQRNEVTLVWPFKDCLLEGGQSSEEQKREEVFFNQILAQDEITKLKEPKVFSNPQKYTANGEQQFNAFNRNQTGQITDNLIIKGNNLLALYSLKQQFAGKVKLIYIDPPYNTGNDGFKYNDNFNHSTWLTFMKNRLEVARELLKDDGVIFVQIDDKEQAYLKVLMDEVFCHQDTERKSFIGTLIHQRAKGGGNAKNIVKGHDYILIYNKSPNDTNKFIRDKIIQGKVVTINGEDFIRDDDVIRKVFGKYDKSLGDRRCFYEELHLYKTKEQIKDINKSINNRELVLEDFGNGMRVIVKYKSIKNSHSKLYSIIKAMSENATNHLSSIGINFSNPKPEELIEFIINSVTQPSDIVLDFHLGSGTTAAVAHKMGRQYIGIEQMSYIQTIAVARLKKVIGKSTKHTITNQEKTQLQQILYKLQNNHKLI